MDALLGVVFPSWGSCLGSLVVAVVVDDDDGAVVAGVGVVELVSLALDFPFALDVLLVVVVWLAGVSVTPSAEKGIDGSIFRITRNEAITAVPPGK